MKKTASMIKIIKLLFLCSFTSCFIISCKEQKEDFPSNAPLSNYMPLAVGKYFIYRLDSTVASEDAKSLVVHKYQVKDTIDGIVSDAQGRKSYRIRRFINNETGTGTWLDNATILVTPVINTSTGESIEVVDNNLRYIKLKAPLRDGFTWQGNSYINTTTSAVKYLNGWEYVYEDFGLPLKIGSQNYPDALTVLQQPDEGGKLNLSDTTVKFDERNYSIEKYAGGIGLVYREFIHWAFQRDPGDANRYYFEENSYGVKLTLIKHN